MAVLRSLSPGPSIGAALMVLLGLAGPGPVAGQVELTQEEALAEAFGSAEVERRTAYLGDAGAARIAAATGIDPDEVPRVVTHYVALAPDGTPLGAAYFDVHRVRTLPEVLMIVVRPDGTVGRVEVLKFSEPPEYLPPGGWLAQFQGRGAGDGISLKQDIVNLTGATLTAEAVTSAVQRILATHGEVRPFRQEDGGR